ncbi:MAG: DUF4173 domain-containing protein [Christensenellaceae bacterium]|nr:DUF4173 domain-containing protein [Christensenellaceae bacterium]
MEQFSTNQGDRLPNGAAMNDASIENGVLIQTRSMIHKENLLLLGAAVVAILFDRYITNGLECWLYCAFFAVFTAVMLILNRSSLKESKEILFIVGAVVVLMINLTVDYYRGDRNSFDITLAMLNTLFAIPALLMSIPAILTYGLSANAVGRFAKSYLTTAFVNTFRFFGKPFGALIRVFHGRDKGIKHVALGLTIGVPIFIILIMLLSSADAVMKISIESIFDFDEDWFGRLLLHLLFLILPMFLISYSLIYSVMNKRDIGFTTGQTNIRFNDTSAAIIMSCMLIAYAIFAGFQFTYFTGLHGLPEGLTYSEYAVNGFSELNVVTIINMSVFALVLTFCKNGSTGINNPIKGLLIALLASTMLLLVSAMARLIMYIDAYGLTTKRVLAFWLEIATFIVLIFGTIKLFKPKFRAAYWTAAAIILWYLVLNIVNCGALIEKSALVLNCLP